MISNPTKKFVESDGIDLPIMYVYLAGRIAGNCIDKCLGWRYQIVNYYKNYKLLTPEKGEKYYYGAYPIAFLDALNSNEAECIDAKGLTSAIPPNLIYSKDLMSVRRADALVCHMEDFMGEGMEDLLGITEGDLLKGDRYFWQTAFLTLQGRIKNRRPNYGTNSEMAWGLLLNKPVILIAGTKERKEILELHPFTRKASVIVETVEDLLEGKYLNLLYKSIASSVY